MMNPSSGAICASIERHDSPAKEKWLDAKKAGNSRLKCVALFGIVLRQQVSLECDGAVPAFDQPVHNALKQVEIVTAETSKLTGAAMIASSGKAGGIAGLNGTAAEESLRHHFVIHKLVRPAGGDDITGFQQIGAVGDFQRLARFLFHQQ